VLLAHVPAMPAQLAALADALPSTTAIWLGGQAALAVPHDALPARCIVLRGETELEQRLEMLAA